jgi:putative membrane protein
MTKLILRWTINAIALWVAISFVPGIHSPGSLSAILELFSGSPAQAEINAAATGLIVVFALALIFGLVNALVRPLITFLTCPLIILTLGLGTLLVNALMFWLTSVISTAIEHNFGYPIGFTVDGFWPAFFGALVISIVSVVLSLFVKDAREWRRSKQ